jgi:hypothetical protein
MFKKYRSYIIAIGVLLIVLVIVLALRGSEDTWIKDSSGNWQKHGNPSAESPAN